VLSLFKLCSRFGFGQIDLSGRSGYPSLLILVMILVLASVVVP
jgi:hypothetical protein